MENTMWVSCKRMLQCNILREVCTLHNFWDWCSYLIKTIFGCTGHHHSQNSPILHICTIPRQCLNVLCEGVQHFRQFCLDHLSYVKMAPSIRETEISHGVSLASRVKKEMWGSALSWCCSQLFCNQFRGKVFAHFHAVTVKWQFNLRNCLLGLPWWIL
jgi:hypothetical protein